VTATIVDGIAPGVPFTKDFEITVTPVITASSVTVTGKANSKTLNMSGQNVYLTTYVHTFYDNTLGEYTKRDTFSSIPLTYTFTPTNVTYDDLDWTSTNPDAAHVSSKTLYGGSKTGTATLTGTTKDGSNRSVTFTVTVINGVVMDSKDRGSITITIGETKTYDLAIGPNGNGTKPSQFTIRARGTNTAGINWSIGPNYVRFTGVSKASQLSIETYIDGDFFNRTQGLTPYIYVTE
jgi:hypothetical protein